MTSSSTDVVISFDTKEEIERNSRLYEHADVVKQRKRLVDILNPGTVDRCLDVGCGAGFLLAELRRAIPNGDVHGVDVSEGMLRAARARCPDAFLQRASAVALPYVDDTFDIIVFCQVLVYVSDPLRALQEAMRCLRPCGRLVVLDSIWSQSVWNVRDVNRQARILRAFDKHALHPELPMRVPQLIASVNGLSCESTHVIPIVGTSWKASWGRLVAPVIAQFVLKHELVEKDVVAEWLADLWSRADENTFFFNINRYVFVASKTQ